MSASLLSTISLLKSSEFGSLLEEALNCFNDVFLTKDLFTSITAGIILAILFFVIRDYINSRNNLSGKWIMYETIMDSDYNPYLGMKLLSTLNILHIDKGIIGSGEKISETTILEGEKTYPSQARVKYLIDGGFEWKLFGKSRFKFLYKYENKESREISCFVSLKKVGKNRLEGWFISEAANSSGTITLIKKDFSEFGTGTLFWLGIFFSRILKVKLIENIEHHYLKNLSRSKKISGKNLKFKSILVIIEDKNFYNHVGFSFKPLLRGLLSRLRFFRKRYNIIKSGGSTISMQLARSLFIVDYQKTYRRKLIEIIFALYLETILTKEEILDLYMISVRFHYKIHGINAAIRFFNFDNQHELSAEESFFLIERLSNTSKLYSPSRINLLFNKFKTEDIKLNYGRIIEIYKKSPYKKI